MFIHDYIREHLLMTLNFMQGKQPSLNSLQKTEWSYPFEKLMRNRLIMGALRYGLLKVPGKVKYDRVDSIKKRLALYEESGNAEHLVDIANMCLLEFEEPNHKDFHWKAQDDTNHTEVLKDGNKT